MLSPVVIVQHLSLMTIYWISDASNMMTLRYSATDLVPRLAPPQNPPTPPGPPHPPTPPPPPPPSLLWR
jgi:hypothetical protein